MTDKIKLLEEIIESCRDRYGDNRNEIAKALFLLNEIKEAINYTRCCKSDSELLPKRLSNEAYTMARGTDHKTFTKWWDMQKV